MIHLFGNAHPVEAAHRRYLCDLVSINSVYINPQGIEEALRYCEREIIRQLPQFIVRRDDAGNLIAYSGRFNRARNAVMFSAHIDTVDADPAEWKSHSRPFQALETITHIIGRGANDCKAGVAMMLLVSQLERMLELDNVVLLFSYREEGNRAKTSTRIGEELGRSIPLSDRKNLLLCLENTVRLEETGPTLDAYDCEPCNAFISVNGDLAAIRSLLRAHPHWKPVAIKPRWGTLHLRNPRLLAGTSGHAATVRNGDNVIYQAIMNEHNGCIDGGDEGQPSVVANRVRIWQAPDSPEHSVVLNYRGLTSISSLKESLGGIAYKEHLPFDFAAGSDRRQVLKHGLARKIIAGLNGNAFSVQFSPNPGRSDASAIWNAAREQQHIEVITMGPGTRSHVDKGVSRRTHGPDEGFHKEAGYRAIAFIFRLASRYLAA